MIQRSGAPTPSGLRLVSRVEELLSEPVGRALSGASFLTWCFTPSLAGTVHFGQRDVADATTLMRLYALVGHRSLRLPLRRIVDGRDFAGVDSDAWDLQVRVMGGRLPDLRHVIERQALVLRPGPEGVRVSSLLTTGGPGDPFEPFADPLAAFRWADPEHGPAAYAAVEALMAEVSGPSRVVAQVRAWIAANLRAASVEACARALGSSRRSLQRQLARAETSFRELLQRARVATARQLLTQSDAKVAAVAHAVGFSSTSQLSVALRRAGGPAPSRLREPASPDAADPETARLAIHADSLDDPSPHKPLP